MNFRPMNLWIPMRRVIYESYPNSAKGSYDALSIGQIKAKNG